MSAPVRQRLRDVAWRLRTDALWLRRSLIDGWVPGPARGRIEALLAASPLVVVDLGARGGVKALRELRGHTRVIGFEPNEAECAPLSQEWHAGGYRQATFLPVAVWSGSGERTLRLTRSPGAISFFEPNSTVIGAYTVLPDRLERVGEQAVRTTSLDELAGEQAIDHVDLLKMDVQGSELEAIKGGTALLGACWAVVTEVMFAAMYHDAPVFRDIDAALGALGFSLLAIEHAEYPSVRSRAALPPGTGDKGEWIWADGVYVKDVFADPDLIDPDDPAAVIRFLLVLESLGYVGHALDVARLATERGVAERDLIDAIATAIVRRHRVRWYESTFLARGIGGRVARRLLGREPYTGGRANYL